MALGGQQRACDAWFGALALGIWGCKQCFPSVECGAPPRPLHDVYGVREAPTLLHGDPWANTMFG